MVRICSSGMYSLNRPMIFSQQVLLSQCHGKFVPGFHDGKMSHSTLAQTAWWLRLLDFWKVHFLEKAPMKLLQIF